MNYEINFLVLQSQTENIDTIRKEVRNLIKAQEGEITDELVYQKRKLAYEIKHEQYGFYTVYRFDLEDGIKLKELTKGLNLEKGVTRHIIVRSDEIPELQKEIGKAPKTEEERKAEAMKKMPKQKVGKKILDEIGKETSAETTKEESVEEKVTPIKKDAAPKVVKTTKVASAKKEEETKTVEAPKKDTAKKETKVETTETSKEDASKKETKTKTATASKEDAVKKETKVKTTKKTELTEEKSSEKTSDTKKEKISMDDLDKKLDEILDL